MSVASRPNRSQPVNTPDGEITPPALTDIFDDQRGILLVRYPAALIVGLGISGIIAFAITGFLGYPLAKDSPITVEWRLFHQPWALFLWLCALLLTFQATVFRNQQLRRRLVRPFRILMGVCHDYGLPSVRTMRTICWCCWPRRSSAAANSRSTIM
jgi:MFS family permease